MPDEFFERLMKLSSPDVRERLAKTGGRTLAEEWRVTAQLAHPELKISAVRLAEHLARHLTLEAFVKPAAWLPSDLLLALACLDAQPAAIAQLERWLKAGNRDDEVVQRAREKMLVGPPPRLEQYAGRSPLKAWVALVARRIALDVLREDAADPAGGPPTLAGLINATPELQLVQRDALKRVTAALKDALEALDEKDRMLLRRHYLEGETQGALALELKTTRSTLASWIEKARARLLAQTRSGLKGATRMGSAELDSLLQVVESNLDLSFSELKLR